MTTGSGSRGGGASRAQGTGGGADDRDDDDPKLRAMRAVWLSMRQEDPPGSGLSELLAAARAKAETMQPRPSWWQRLLAGLRRPPALAFATVLVVVGGAVIFGRHADRVELRDGGSGAAVWAADRGLRATPTAGEAPGAGSPEAPPASERGTGLKTSKAASTDQGVAAAADGWKRTTVTREADAREGGLGTLDSSRGGAAAPGRGPEETDSPGEDAAPGGAATKVGSSSGSLASGHGAAVSDKDLAPARPQPAGRSVAADNAPPKLQRRGEAAGPRRDGALSDDDDAGATSRDETPSSTDEAKQREAHTDATTTANAAAPGNAARPGSQRGSLEQLYKQCESAARRGDCVGVKRIVGRITATDRGYRARLASDSPIAKCLAD